MNAIVRWRESERSADKLTAIYSQPPIPVLEIAESNGVDVVFADFGKHSDAVAGLCDFKEKKIYVNAQEKPERQSFTIAHELGHWKLHRDFYLANPDKYPVLPRFSEPNQADPFEKEANKFAACLLVPRRLLDPAKSAAPEALARAFGVSRTMMEWRLKNVR